jgi:hypothetical protein
MKKLVKTATFQVKSEDLVKDLFSQRDTLEVAAAVLRPTIMTSFTMNRFLSGPSIMDGFKTAGLIVEDARYQDLLALINSSLVTNRLVMERASTEINRFIIILNVGQRLIRLRELKSPDLQPASPTAVAASIGHRLQYRLYLSPERVEES